MEYYENHNFDYSINEKDKSLVFFFAMKEFKIEHDNVEKNYLLFKEVVKTFPTPSEITSIITDFICKIFLCKPGNKIIIIKNFLTYKQFYMQWDSLWGSRPPFSNMTYLIKNTGNTFKGSETDKLCQSIHDKIITNSLLGIIPPF